MSKRVFKLYTDYSAKQRVSLRNGDIPGRMAKPYHVSFLDAWENPPYVTHVDHIGPGSFSGTGGSRRGLDTSGWIPESQDSSFEPLGFPDSGDVVVAAEASAIRALNKARDTAFNAAVATAELPSAVKMFASTAARIVRAQAALRKGNLPGAYKALGKDYRGRTPSKDKVRDRASNYWLELQYGWLPLLSDVFAAAHKAASMQQAPRFSVRGTASQTLTERFGASLGGTVVVHQELGVQVVFSYAVENGFIAHAASMGFTNPMLIAWETVPLSFVVDWLIPIGGWLQGFSAFHGLSFVDGCVTRKGVHIYTVSYPGTSSSSYRTLVNPDGSTYAQLTSTTSVTGSSIYARNSGFRRDTMSEFPSVRFPSVGLDLTWRKLATSIALLNQKRK